MPEIFEWIVMSPVTLARTHDDRTIHASTGSGGGRVDVKRLIALCPIKNKSGCCRSSRRPIMARSPPIVRSRESQKPNELGMPRPASTSPLLWLYALNSIVRLRHALSVFPIGETEVSAISQLRPDLIYIGTLDDMARKNLRPKQFVTN